MRRSPSLVEDGCGEGGWEVGVERSFSFRNAKFVSVDEQKQEREENCGKQEHEFWNTKIVYILYSVYMYEGEGKKIKECSKWDANTFQEIHALFCCLGLIFIF